MNENLTMLFSSNLDYWLKRRNKTQADLYKRLHVSSATASDWCNAKKIPRTDKLVEIADWLMVDLSDLLYKKEHIESKLNDIIYKLHNDDEFQLLVENINEFDKDTLDKVIDYVELLKKSRG